MRAAALVALFPAVATTIDSSLECSSSEAAVGPFAYGAEPVPQQRCVARNARLSRNPLALHLVASNATERARLQRVWGDADTAVQFHQHVMNLPVLVHNESGQPSPCAQQIDSALAISVPDLSNLYHVFFDLLAPLADTLLSLNRTLGVVHPRLIALHNPIATRAQPWLLPIRRSGYLGEPPAAVAAEYFLEGDSSGWNIEEEAPVDACRLAEGLGGKAYQFVDYLAAAANVGRPKDLDSGPESDAIAAEELIWLTPPAPSGFPTRGRGRRQHQKCLSKFDLHRGEQAEQQQTINSLPNVLDADDLGHQMLCFQELHLNIRTRSSLWQYEHSVPMHPQQLHAPLAEAFHELFRVEIPRYLGLQPPEYPASDARKRSKIVFLIRSSTETRATQNISAMETALRAAASRAVKRLQVVITVETLDATQLTLREQVRTMGSTVLLVGDHGAGLSNGCVFMAPKRGSVVEIVHKSCGIHCGDYFRPACELSGVYHTSIPAENIDSSSTDGGADFVSTIDRSIDLVFTGGAGRAEEHDL